LALPREAHEFYYFNSLAVTLGKRGVIAFQCLSLAIPKLIPIRDVSAAVMMPEPKARHG
jgi:hypothetical protein